MDPNLLNQLLGLLNRHAQSVAASSQQPTDATTYLRHRQFVDGNSGPSNAVQGLQSGINSAPFTGNPYGTTPLFMTGLPPQGSPSSWGDFLQQQLQQLSTTANYLQPTPFAQPAPSKWVLGPGYATYNGVLQSRPGYVPPIPPTGKYSVAPAQAAYGSY